MAEDEVNLKPDMPYLRVQLSDPAYLECCYTTNVKSLESTWVIRSRSVEADNATLTPRYVNSSDLVTMGHKPDSGVTCGTLSFKSVQLNDSGLYLCWLNSSKIYIFSHGTYLHVYSECCFMCSAVVGGVLTAVPISRICWQACVFNSERWSQLSSKRR